MNKNNPAARSWPSWTDAVRFTLAPPLDDDLVAALQKIRQLVATGLASTTDAALFTALDRIENAARNAIMAHMERDNEPLDDDAPF